MTLFHRRIIPDPAPTHSTDSDLGKALAEYLEASESGNRPDRAAFVARHPGLSTELRAFFTNQDELERLESAVRRELSPSPPKGPPTAPLPKPFGGYLILEEIGRGGMGAVYKAEQHLPHRLVAVKLIHGGVLASPADRKRFHVEAEAAARLEHPNIVPLYGQGEEEGQQYLAMRLIEGGSLDQHVERFVGEPRVAARLMANVARAVQHAHERGVLHRDLKPANILLDAYDNPFVTDFGLARFLESDSTLTQTGAAIGTPSYMAPEQAAGKGSGLTTSADVYALGVILYELLVGLPPFHGSTRADVLRQVLMESPTPPSKADAKVPRDLETIAMKCLEKVPTERYASARELAQDIDRWLEGFPILARPVSAPRRVLKWARRRPAAAALLAVIALSTALFATLAVAFVKKDATEAAWRSVSERQQVSSMARIRVQMMASGG